MKNPMPARKIPKNHLSVTGSFASRKNGHMGGFESLLEKEYMLLLDFDETVEGFEEQPVTIPVPGVPRGYTPDLLVRFRAGLSGDALRAPLLTEIKHTDDLKKNGAKYANKFAIAEQYVVERGWEFSIRTEKDIRTPRLGNLKFLREYRNFEPAREECDRVLRAIKANGGESSQNDLVRQLTKNDDDTLGLLPVIWNLVLTGKIATNLDVTITGDTLLRLPRDIQ
jgi:hypothetical protein